MVGELLVTPEEKDLLDWFTKGLPGRDGGCDYLHGTRIRVEGSNIIAKVLVAIKYEEKFGYYVLNAVTPEELHAIKRAHEHWEDERAQHLAELARNWVEYHNDAPLHSGPFDFVCVCGVKLSGS